MIRRFAVYFFVVLSLACPALAQTMAETPLMVIRFNQPHVTYERSLYNTMTRAMEVRPNATFELVSVSPVARSTQAQERNNQLATNNMQRVLNTMAEIGMPPSRLQQSNALENVASSEVRIFIR